MFQFLQSLALDFLYTSGVHFLPGNFRGQENKLNSNVQKIIKSSSVLCTDAPPPPPPSLLSRFFPREEGRLYTG